MEREVVFAKDEIVRRLQLPVERIDILIEECGMPTDDEEKYAAWFADNSDRILEELEKFGPIAREEASHLVFVSQPSDGNSHKSRGISQSPA